MPAKRLSACMYLAAFLLIAVQFAAADAMKETTSVIGRLIFIERLP